MFCVFLLSRLGILEMGSGIPSFQFLAFVFIFSFLFTLIQATIKIIYHNPPRFSPIRSQSTYVFPLRGSQLLFIIFARPYLFL